MGMLVEVHYYNVLYDKLRIVAMNWDGQLDNWCIVGLSCVVICTTLLRLGKEFSLASEIRHEQINGLRTQVVQTPSIWHALWIDPLFRPVDYLLIFFSLTYDLAFVIAVNDIFSCFELDKLSVFSFVSIKNKLMLVKKKNEEIHPIF